MFLSLLIVNSKHWPDGFPAFVVKVREPMLNLFENWVILAEIVFWK